MLSLLLPSIISLLSSNPNIAAMRHYVKNNFYLFVFTTIVEPLEKETMDFIGTTMQQIIIEKYAILLVLHLKALWIKVAIELLMHYISINR